MNTIVLMAGDAKRFECSKYADFKPLINVRGKEIVKWTTDSLNRDLRPLTFAIRTDHNIKYGVEDKLKAIYSADISFCRFNSLTRGNLETAYFTALGLNDKHLPLLILDSDNKYNGENVIANFARPRGINHAGICYFEPLNDSTKWCFAVPEDSGRIIKLAEKDEETLNNGGKPMVGVFYFSSVSLFLDVAKAVLGKGETSKSEFYMSQSINHLLDMGIDVYGCKVDGVVPLGTPIDVENFEKLND